MRRLFVLILAALLCMAAPASAQQHVALGTALSAAMNDINARQNTSLSWEDGQIAYLYEEVRVNGNHLGCPVVAPTNRNTYWVMVVQIDTQFDNVYEWEYRFAYNEDGVLMMVICDTPPGGTRGPGPQETTRQPSATPTVTPSSTPTPTPTITPTAPPIEIGQLGARLLPPMICGGLPTRLVVGSSGRVISGGASNNVRHAPGLSGAHIDDLFGGTPFTVVDGPVCVDDIPWYAVAVGGELRGWTAEGRGADYYIEPVLTDAMPIMPGNAAVMQPWGLAYAPGTVGITTPHAGQFVSYDADSAQVWLLPQDQFTTLAEARWQPLGSEIVGQFNFAHQDLTGRVWTSDALSGVLQSPGDTLIAPFQQPVVGGLPILAVDVESNFIAIPGTAPNTVTLYSVDQVGGGNTEAVSLALTGPARAVAFGAAGATLYVATDTQVTVYRADLDGDWDVTPVAAFAHDLLNPQIATSTAGDVVVLSGTGANGAPGLRVFEISPAGGLTASVTARTLAAGDIGTQWSAPAVNPMGTLVAVSTSLGTLRVIDTTTGAVINELATGGFGPVAFSTDGLVLLAPAANFQVQMYGVTVGQPGVAVVTATPTFGPLVVTATPTFGPIVVTATPEVIVVTATDTMMPTLPAPPTPEGGGDE